MNSAQIEKGIKEHLGSIESFLKTVLMKKVSVEMPASSEAEADMLQDALRTGTIIVQATEKKFGIDIFIAFDENWIPSLSNAMLGMEENDVNEVTRDLIKEFTQQLLGSLQVSLKDAGIETNPDNVSILKSAQIGSAVDKDNYFIAQLAVSGKFEIEGDETPDMAMIAAFQVPSDARIQEVMGVDDEPEPAATGGGFQFDDSATDEDEFLSGSNLSEAEIESLLADSEDLGGSPVAAPARPKQKPQGPPVKGRKVEFDEFNSNLDFSSSAEVRNLSILKDVELTISVELGRKDLPLGEVLHLVRGSVVELDKLAGEPVEVYANGHRIAEGEVVVIDEHFGVRVTNLVSTRERLESLR